MIQELIDIPYAILRQEVVAQSFEETNQIWVENEPEMKLITNRA